MVRAFIMVKTAAGKSADLQNRIREMDAVLDANVVAGQYDIIVEAEAEEVYDVIHTVATNVRELDGVVDTLRETIRTDDGFEQFSTAHALAMVREEYPDRMASADLSGDGGVGYALVWVADFDSRELHRIVVELLVELMEHAISHADARPTVAEFEQQMAEFDVDGFVDAYRRERELEDEHDTAL